MSPSRDNLPAVEPLEPPLLEERTRKTLTDVRWLLALGLGSVAAVVVATASTIAFAQDAGVKAVEPVVAELARVKAQQVEQERRMANVERMTVETNATLKLVAMRLGVTPITLEPKDAGP